MFCIFCKKEINQYTENWSTDGKDYFHPECENEKFGKSKAEFIVWEKVRWSSNFIPPTEPFNK